MTEARERLAVEPKAFRILLILLQEGYMSQREKVLHGSNSFTS
jgi:hypothetical protein